MLSSRHVLQLSSSKFACFSMSTSVEHPPQRRDAVDEHRKGRPSFFDVAEPGKLIHISIKGQRTGLMNMRRDPCVGIEVSALQKCPSSWKGSQPSNQFRGYGVDATHPHSFNMTYPRQPSFEGLARRYSRLSDSDGTSSLKGSMAIPQPADLKTPVRAS